MMAILSQFDRQCAMPTALRGHAIDRKTWPLKAVAMPPLLCRLCLLAACSFSATSLFAQAVCLPAPRLLTTMPMGGKAGTEVEITIGGESLEDVGDLLFSDPKITAAKKLDAGGKPVPNVYVVKIAADCP